MNTKILKALLDLSLASLLFGVLACSSSSSDDSAPSTDTGDDDAYYENAGIASCTTNEVFTNSPIPMTDLQAGQGFLQIGLFNPGGNHVFPSDHMGVYTNGGGKSIFAPGHGFVRSIRMKGTNDFEVIFYPCKEIRLRFGHVYALSTVVQAAYAVSSVPTSCASCGNALDVELNAGDELGTSAASFDFGMWDGRLTKATGFASLSHMTEDTSNNFDNFHVACPLDYYNDVATGTGNTDHLKTTLFGLINHITKPATVNTLSHLCGSINTDVSGKAMGRWYRSDVSGELNEADHIALIPSTISADPVIQSFSFGSSSGMGSAVARYLVPKAVGDSASGRENISLINVGPDSLIYCYDSWTNQLAQSTSESKIILIRMNSTTSLDIEAQNGASCTATYPWAFVTSHNFVR